MTVQRHVFQNNQRHLPFCDVDCDLFFLFTFHLPYLSPKLGADSKELKNVFSAYPSILPQTAHFPVS